MKFTVFCSAVLFAMSTMLDSSQLGVKAVPIATNTFSSDKTTIIDDSDAVGLSQWGVSPTMGPIDLTAGEQDDQLYMGQLYSDSTQDDLELVQKYKAPHKVTTHKDKGLPTEMIVFLVILAIIVVCCFCAGCFCCVTKWAD